MQSQSSLNSFSGDCCRVSSSCCKHCAAAVVSSRGWLKHEISMLLKLAFPITLSIFFQFSMLMISLFFIGHIPNSDSALYYGSAGLASSFVNVTSTPIGHGLGTAADTLCSQAFGHKNYKRVGIILQRGIFILGIFILPICGLWLNAKSLLLLLHQPPCVASLSAFYVNLYCITLPFLFLFILLQHYLQSQSLVWQFVLIGLVANCTNIVLHALLIYAFHLGFKGAVIALVISTCLPPVLAIFYIRIRKLHEMTWVGWSLESLNEWGQFLKLALPGMAMMCLEWWAIEAASFVAGTISEEELATNAAWFQATYFIYMPAIGIAMATSIRVGNELGASNPRGAKKVSFVAIGCVLSLCVLYTVLFLATKDYIGILFVPGNEIVRKKVANMMYVICTYIYFDHVQIVIGGVFRGSGRQYIGAIMNVIGYYVIGLPLGITLALKVQWGILGLWIGMNFGCAFLCLTFVVILLRTNWKKQSEIAIQRARKDGEKIYTSSKIVATNEDKLTAELQAKNNTVCKLNEQHEDEVTLLSDSAKEIPLNELQEIKADMDSIMEVETRMNSNLAQSEEQEKTEEVRNGAETGDTQLSRSLRSKSQLLRVLGRGSFFAIGLAILMVGGVASNYQPYYVDPGEYENCSTAQLNEII